MDKQVPGERWRQLRAAAVATTEGQAQYEAGYQQAANYRQTMRLLDGMRRALGISQSELARRMAKAQPTVARLLRHGENPTLATIEETLRGLGLRGRLLIEPAAPDTATLTVEVGNKLVGAEESIPER